MQIEAAEAGVTVTIQSAPDVPTLWADERRVKQIVVNLLSNGIKFTPAGGRVVVEASLRAGAINIAVRDSGSEWLRQRYPKHSKVLRRSTIAYRENMRVADWPALGSASCRATRRLAYY